MLFISKISKIFATTLQCQEQLYIYLYNNMPSDEDFLSLVDRYYKLLNEAWLEELYASPNVSPLTVHNGLINIEDLRYKLQNLSRTFGTGLAPKTIRRPGEYSSSEINTIWRQYLHTPPQQTTELVKLIDKERHRLPEGERCHSERDAEWLFQHLKVATSIKWDEDVVKECNELYKEAHDKNNHNPPIPRSAAIVKHLNKKYASRGHIYTLEQVRDYHFAGIYGRGADLRKLVEEGLERKSVDTLEKGESAVTSKNGQVKEKADGRYDSS